MKKVVIKFRDILELVDFQSVTDTFSCETNSDDLIITCILSDAQIELAERGYRAEITEAFSV
ncbi:MAG: hypothetical protein JWP88_1221 [Flaviaesturariibacter sp.]|nr:hypothetical protein [Flaviaesturariibacter sp.]